MIDNKWLILMINNKRELWLIKLTIDAINSINEIDWVAINEDRRVNYRRDFKERRLSRTINNQRYKKCINSVLFFFFCLPPFFVFRCSFPSLFFPSSFLFLFFLFSFLFLFFFCLFVLNRNLDYVCKENGRCIVDVSRRNQCQACRFTKCLQVNMKRDGTLRLDGD